MQVNLLKNIKNSWIKKSQEAQLSAFKERNAFFKVKGQARIVEKNNVAFTSRPSLRQESKVAND